jgi:dihydroorotate dehydrogenase
MPLDAYRLLRPLLFRLQTETAHGLAFAAGGVAQRLPGLLPLLAATCGRPDPALRRRVCGLDFPSPIGLAAGLDKEAQLLPIWKALGFGHVEIGTITPRPQPGNPRPRCFRIPAEGVILNRMGFNSQGAEAVAQRLRHRPAGLIVGGNLGKNKATPEAQALDDYRRAYQIIAPLVDYIAINISSPNTPGLRNLQAPASLAPLLEGILSIRKEMGLEAQPIFVKLSPDIQFEELDIIVDTIANSGASGIIATNTTLDRGILGKAAQVQVATWGDGGLSGRALAAKARAVRQRIRARLPAHLSLIACGGLGTPEEVHTALAEGAALAQVYSALIFEGPWLPARILAALKADGS